VWGEISKREGRARNQSLWGSEGTDKESDDSTPRSDTSGASLPSPSRPTPFAHLPAPVSSLFHYTRAHAAGARGVRRMLLAAMLVAGEQAQPTRVPPSPRCRHPPPLPTLTRSLAAPPAPASPLRHALWLYDCPCGCKARKAPARVITSESCTRVGCARLLLLVGRGDRGGQGRGKRPGPVALGCGCARDMLADFPLFRVPAPLLRVPTVNFQARGARIENGSGRGTGTGTGTGRGRGRSRRPPNRRAAGAPP